MNKKISKITDKQKKHRKFISLEDQKIKRRLLSQVQGGLRETTMSIDEISRLSEVSRTTIYRIKSCDGQCKARLHTLNLLLKVMNQRDEAAVARDETMGSERHSEEVTLFTKWLTSFHAESVKSVSEPDYKAFRELARRYFSKDK